MFCMCFVRLTIAECNLSFGLNMCAFNNLWLLLRRTKFLIDKLKQSKNGELEPEGFLGDCCSETKTELDNLSTDDRSDCSFSPNKHEQNALRLKSYDIDDESNENVPLISLLQSNKSTAKQRPACGTAPNASSRPCGSPAQSISRSTGSFTVNRKRVRVILSDDEVENDEDGWSGRMGRRFPVEGIATSDECKLQIMFILILTLIY